MSTYGYACITPQKHCLGSLARLNSGLEKGGVKKHGSSEEAMRCYTHYLMEHLNCERLSAREFRHPNGGPIEVLTKPVRFGARLRSGKSGEGMSKADRGMPLSHALVTSS